MFGYAKLTALTTLTFVTLALSNPVPAPKANAKIVKMRGRQVADVGPVGVSVPVGPVSIPIGGVGVANGGGVLGTGGDDNDVGGYIPLIFGGDDSEEGESEGSTDEGSEDTTETTPEDDDEESTGTEASVDVSDETSV